MFWSVDFNPSPSSIDLILRRRRIKLSDVLYNDDLLQELKVSNSGLIDFLSKKKVISELLNNITLLTEKDCCVKLSYSKVHAAYISCEILASGSRAITHALLNNPEALSKIISCLVYEPKQSSDNEESVEIINYDEDDETGENNEPASTAITVNSNIDDEQEKDNDCEKESDNNDEKLLNDNTDLKENGLTDEKENLITGFKKAIIVKMEKGINDEEQTADDNAKQTADDNAKQTANNIVEKEIDNNDEKVDDNIEIEQDQEKAAEEKEDDKISDKVIRVAPQKAALVSKLISTLHNLAASNLSCHVSQDIDTFSRLINVLINNIDISGCFEILSTFISSTTPPEMRFVFCEILSKLNLIQSLIDVMTLSEVEDKQRNACQLLCDIIITSRQEAFEAYQDVGLVPESKAFDMLTLMLESRESIHRILSQMFHSDEKNLTAIVCGIKVMQTLVEQKCSNRANITNNVQVSFRARVIEQIQDDIVEYLIKFHELLSNPPKQEPIKTTFGIIQKPLGYVRFEVVNLIRALIGTNSPQIISKLVELRTMLVIIDLFIDYSWNNLLHTQVEQALCLIIRNCRLDEESSYQLDMQNHSHSNICTLENMIRESLSSLDGSSNGNDKGHTKIVDEKQINGDGGLEDTLFGDIFEMNEDQVDGQPQINNHSDKIAQEDNKQQQEQQQHSSTSGNSRALLAQLLNDYGLIRKLLKQPELCEQANFGHIIQIINSIAINCDLDTIRDHLNDMKENNPALYDRWTTFVNVDVASFKEISLYYDAQSANNRVGDRVANNQRPLSTSNSIRQNSSPAHNANAPGNDSTDHFYTYFSFTSEAVLPALNVDVLPKMRRSKNVH